MRTRLIPFATVGLAAALAACDNDSLAPFKSAERVSAAVRSGEQLIAVVITSTPSGVSVGGKVRLESRLDFSAGGTLDGRRWTSWTTLDPTIAVIGTNGLVTGRGNGIARLVASVDELADTLALPVGTARDSSAIDPVQTDSTVTDSTGADSTGTGAPADTSTNDSTATPPPPPVASSPVELPRTSVDTRLVTPTGRRLLVRAGGLLQAAIDTARPGDVIALEQGAEFVGHYRLRRKSGDGWITIRTAGSDATLPAPGTRMTPARAASAMLPRILTPDISPAIGTDSGAHHYRILGVEVGATSTVTSQSGLVTLGASGTYQSQASEVPHHIILDRVWVHGRPSLYLKRCVTLNSGHSAVIDSYLDDCHADGQDSQAIVGWNGPGPFLIENNYLAGAGENIMFGGADPSIPNLLPSDITIRNNFVYKPAAWKGRWSVKNSLEFKAAQRVLVEGNVFDGNWADGQVGFMWNIKSSNQGGSCTWCVTQHVTLRYNILRNTGGGVTVSGAEGMGPALPTNHIAIMHNVMERIDVEGTAYVGIGRPFQVSSVHDLTIDHNLIDNTTTTSLVMFANNIGRNFRFTNNAAYKGSYGLHGLATYAPAAYVAGNGIVAASGTTIYSTYGPGNVVVRTLSEAKQVPGTDALPAGASTSTVVSMTSEALP